MKTLFIIIIVLNIVGLSAVNLTIDKVRKNLKGIKLYEEQKYEEATDKFQENVNKNYDDGVLRYNLGNSLYRQGDYDRAISEYARALRDDKFEDKSAVYHNIGNALFEQQKYKEALASYRNSVIANPENEDARHNYELTRLLLQEMQEEEQESDGSDSSEQQELSEMEKSDGDGDDVAQVFEDNEDEGDESQDSQLEKEKKLEEAEQILRSIMAKEKDLLEEEKEQAPQQNLRGKFW